MGSKLRLVFTITIVFFSFYGTAQDRYWQRETSQKKIDRAFIKRFNVQKGMVFNFDEGLFKKELRSLTFAKTTSRIVFFPNKEGEIIAFQVKEAPVLSPALAAKYPQIKSYVGHALNDAKIKIRFSMSHKGIQSMLVAANGKGNTYMQKNSSGNYVLYTRDGYSKTSSEFICSTMATIETIEGSTTFKRPVTGQVLRKFRLAVSASGEYTGYHGGTVADALAAINATITRVNQVFENDLAVTLELIPAMEAIIFTNAATDPYSDSWSSEVQNTLSTTIGEENYDLGILLHKANKTDGNAGTIGNVCVDRRKGSAYATGIDPQGDSFDLDFVAHEMGHQFGANHTWSFENENTNSVQVEPGSGTTIMGYAGISGDQNVAANGDDYFHYVSISQISDYLETVGCAEMVPLVNVPPVVTPTGGFTIPVSTAFVLSANATDADVADVLTYTWEQVDAGIVNQALFGPTALSGANFRSQRPSTDPSRYFPGLISVLQGSLTQNNPTINTAWETVSEVERELNFALTVRDNAFGGGQVTSDLMRVFVTDDAGPFVVTSQESGDDITSGSVETITWDVANTFDAPVNAKTVDILLSLDGGLTFPIPLANNVDNDGSHTVVMPASPTTGARIMVKASENIFFALNTTEFTIVETEIVLNFTELEYEVCQMDALVVPFTYETYLGFAEEVTFSTNTPPAGLGISFNPQMVTAGDTPVEITFSGTENVATGTYPITVIASSDNQTRQLTIDIHIYGSSFTDVILVSPAEGLINVSAKQALEWQEHSMATSYDIEVSNVPDFAALIENANVGSNAYVPTKLEPLTTYYWRVKPKNSCGEGSFSAPFSYTTIDYNCLVKGASRLPIVISAIGTPVVTSSISFFQDLILADINVNVDLDHSYLEDIKVTLTSPAGTIVTLIERSCGNLKNVNATFDDDAALFECNGSPGISGTVRPLGSLAMFEGESMRGAWTLTISDNAPTDGGVLNAFSLEFCVEGEFRPDVDEDGVFDDGPDLCLGTPLGAVVDLTGCPVFLFPNDAFKLTAQSESCRSANNGQIEIEAMADLAYTVTVIGNTTNTSTNFTNTHLESGLMAGNYTVCLTGTDGTIVYEERCFDVVIAEPQALAVSSKVLLTSRTIELDLTGGAPYTIEFNGALIQTEASKISLNLKEGGNSLKVSTALACQGVFEEQIFVSDAPVAYPNPFTDFVKLAFRTSVETINIHVFSADGRLVHNKPYQVNGLEFELDLWSLPTGLYHLRVEGKNVNQTAKLIKQ